MGTGADGRARSLAAAAAASAALAVAAASIAAEAGESALRLQRSGSGPRGRWTEEAGRDAGAGDGAMGGTIPAGAAAEEALTIGRGEVAAGPGTSGEGAGIQ